MSLLPTPPVWDDHRWLGFEPLRGECSTDVCVVGLGGSGLSCIHELRAQGLEVVGIEAGVVGGGAGGRNGGLFLAGIAAFHHDAVARLGEERAVGLYRRTLTEMDRMTAETPALIRRVGSLRIAASNAEEADCEAQFVAMCRAGLPVERYVGPEGRGLLFPLDGVYNPLSRCRALATSASVAGAHLHEHSAALVIARGEVTTAHGVVRARQIIVAVDGGLDRLFPQLASRVRSLRLQMLATAPAPEVSFPRPVYLRGAYEYWQQLPDGSIALGGFRDVGGEAEWTEEASVTAAVQDQLETLLRGRLGVKAPVTHRWAGVVSYTVSGLPIVEEVESGVWAVGGYNGTGNVVGAICGRGVAQMIARGESELLAGITER